MLSSSRSEAHTDPSLLSSNPLPPPSPRHAPHPSHTARQNELQSLSDQQTAANTLAGALGRPLRATCISLPRIFTNAVELSPEFHLLESASPPGFCAELLAEVVGVVLGEVGVVVAHGVGVDGPHVVVEGFPSLQPHELHLDYFPRLGVHHALQHLVRQHLVRPQVAEQQLLGVELVEVAAEGDLSLAGRLQLESLAVVFELLEVLHGGKVDLLAAYVRHSFIPPVLLLVELLVDDVLLVGGVVEAWTGELEVVIIFAELAGQYLELIGNVAYLVPQEAEEFVVHVAGAEDLNEPTVLQREQH